MALLAALFLPEEPLRPRLVVGVGIALLGLVLAFGESLDLGTGEHTALAALAVILSPLASAIGNVATKKRMAGLDPLVMNGWAMVTGGVLLLARERADRGLGRDRVVGRVDRLDPLPRRVRHRVHVRDADRAAA